MNEFNAFLLILLSQKVSGFLGPSFGSFKLLLKLLNFGEKSDIVLLVKLALFER